ncbi:hypothetical protein EDD11_002671 [Mortierella claussenii]|nr:hypothetical protein EDD11_002671 [Mortierella claussenii]
MRAELGAFEETKCGSREEDDDGCNDNEVQMLLLKASLVPLPNSPISSRPCSPEPESCHRTLWEELPFAFDLNEQNGHQIEEQIHSLWDELPFASDVDIEQNDKEIEGEMRLNQHATASEQQEEENQGHPQRQNDAAQEPSGFVCDAIEDIEQNRKEHYADDSGKKESTSKALDDQTLRQQQDTRLRDQMDDGDGEGGRAELGTIVILERTHHRLFDLSTCVSRSDSDSSNDDDERCGSQRPGSSQSMSSVSSSGRISDSHSVGFADDKRGVLESTTSVGDQDRRMLVNQDHLGAAEGTSNIVDRRSIFILEPSWFDEHEASASMASKSTLPEPSTLSLPSSSASQTPTSFLFSWARRRKQRPYSQFDPLGLKQYQGSSSHQQQQPTDHTRQARSRRAHSLPSSPRPTSASTRATAEGLSGVMSPPRLFMSGYPLTFDLDYGTPLQNQLQDVISAEEDVGDILASHQPLLEALEPEVSGNKSAALFEATVLESAHRDCQPSTTPSVDRPRRQSLLSPGQLELKSQENEGTLLTIKDNTSAGRKGGFGCFFKDHAKKNDSIGVNKKQNKDSKLLEKRAVSDIDALSNGFQCIDEKKQQQQQQQSKQRQATPVKTAPSITFQPRSTEISTDRPEVSGRLVLHIPRLKGLKFHFVSLTLHLRLKESITWTKQDLVTFELDKCHWSQTVWDKKMLLQLQDKQVEEGGEVFLAETQRHLSPAAKVVAAAADSALVSNSTSEGTASTTVSECTKTTPTAQILPVDEWRWEWLMPVTQREVRPESFEGSMGVVWYELEAKCLFRWDKVDKDGNVITPGSVQTSSASSTKRALDDLRSITRGIGFGNHSSSSSTGSNKLLKGLGTSTNKSITQMFGKLRVASKSKKPQFAGDFNMGPSRHEEYMKRSLQKADEAAAAIKKELHARGGEGLEEGIPNAEDDQQYISSVPAANISSTTTTEGDGKKASKAALKSKSNKDTTVNNAIKPIFATPNEPVSFLIRKTLKLHFVRPPQSILSNSAFFLPVPSMSLPTLPSTRKLKAIIPGAGLQVQVQIPSIVSIPGYVHTSRLVPCSKTGGLILVKDGDSNESGEKTSSANEQQQQKHGDLELPDNFQVALTVRKIPKINKNDILRRRYENAPVTADDTGSFSQEGAALRKRLLSQQYHQFNPSSTHQSLGMDMCSDDASTVAGSVHRPWRKDFRVRKVKCEFWQKESCRIPTEDGHSRSIETPMAPVFTYLEKAQEKERLRGSGSHCQEHPLAALGNRAASQSRLSLQLLLQGTTSSGVSTGTRHSGHSSPGLIRPDAATSLNEDDVQRLSLAGQGSVGFTATTQPLRRSISADALNCNQHQRQQQPTSSKKPFMLLIPVPLTNPRLRQSYSWPSSEVPASSKLSFQEHSRSQGPQHDQSGTGFGSELDYPSQFSVQNIMDSIHRPDIRSGQKHVDVKSGGGGSAAYGDNRNGQQMIAPNARIELEHYLTLRLSIDVLEFEGEYEQEDEGRQLDITNNIRNSLVTMVDTSYDTLDTARQSNVSTLAFLSTAAAVLGTHSGHTSLVPSPTSPTGGVLGFISSETAVNEPSLTTIPFESLERRGSNATLSTVAGGKGGHCDSGTTGGGLTNGFTQLTPAESVTNLMPGQQTSSNVSRVSSSTPNLIPGNLNSGVTGHRSGGKLMAGAKEAIGAIKKKASGSLLANIHANFQPRADRAAQGATVQKLKDFVLRVPITVVIHTNDHGQVISAYGTTNPSSENYGVNNNSNISGSGGDDSSLSRSDVHLRDSTTTVNNIVTGASAGLHNPVENTGTSESMSSVAVSASSELALSRCGVDDISAYSSPSLQHTIQQNRAELDHASMQGQESQLNPLVSLSAAIAESSHQARDENKDNNSNNRAEEGVEEEEEEAEAEAEFVVVQVDEDDRNGMSKQGAEAVLHRLAEL